MSSVNLWFTGEFERSQDFLGLFLFRCKWGVTGSSAENKRKSASDALCSFTVSVYRGMVRRRISTAILMFQHGLKETLAVGT